MTYPSYEINLFLFVKIPRTLVGGENDDSIVKLIQKYVKHAKYVNRPATFNFSPQ